MGKLMEYKGYHAIVEYSDEDEAFIGRVFGLADVILFDGESIAELKSSFHDAVDDYLSLCEEIGKKPEREFKGSFNVRLSPELHKAAALKAEEDKLTLNQFVANAVRSYIENSPGQVIIIESTHSANRTAKTDSIFRHFRTQPSSQSYELGHNRRVVYAQ